MTGPVTEPQAGNFDPIVPMTLYFSRGAGGRRRARSDPFYRASVRMGEERRMDEDGEVREWWRYLN